jgi:hypothetical protein
MPAAAVALAHFLNALALLAEQLVQEGRFAGSGGTQEHGEFPALKGEPDAVKRANPVLIDDASILDLKHRVPFFGCVLRKRKT